MNQSRFIEQELIRVGHSDDFSESEVNDIVAFIDKEHYLHYPFNEDGSKNPYQYCYGLGYVSSHEALWAAFVAGIYPNAGFWNDHFSSLVSKRGLDWVFRHAANIYRIVAFYAQDADKLLSAFERFCYDYKRTNILMALPTKKEKDAVCNWEWFENAGFKNYGMTRNKEARIYAKVLDFEPVEYSPIFKAREDEKHEWTVKYKHKRLTELV